MKKSLPWVILAGVLGLMALFLRLQGRLWTCSCGYVLFWSGDINSADSSQQLFDPYTLTHVVHGFMFMGLVSLFWEQGKTTSKLVAVLSLEAVWEMIENTTYIIERYRSGTVALGYFGDTILNSFGDILACAVGAMLASRLGVVRTIALALVLEVILLLTVRDNLALNILMLLYPIEAVRQWQLGH